MFTRHPFPRRSEALRQPAVACATLLAIVAVVAAGEASAQSAPQDPTGADPAVSNTFTQSGNGSQGIIGVNQNAGDFNDQANVATVALTSGDNSAALAQVIADIEQRDNASGGPQLTQTNAIAGSFNNYAGIAQVNQTTGQANTQLNVVALAFAAGANFSPALTDVELRGVATPVGGRVQPSADAGSANTINGSFNQFQGLAQVQQIAGDSNVVVNVVAIAVGTGG